MAEDRGNLNYAIKLDPFNYLPKEFAPLVEAIALKAHKFHKDIIFRKDTKRGLQAATSIVLSNLLKARELDPTLYISLSLSANNYTRSRYTNHALSYRLIIRIIKYLRRDIPDREIEFHTGFLYREKGGQGRWTRIRATESLSTLLKDFQDIIPLITNNTLSVPVSVLEPQLDFEIIRLKDKNKELIDYEDTDETTQMRARVAEWNHYAKGQWPDIFVPDPAFVTLLRHQPDEDQEEAIENVGEDRGAVLDLTKRFLYRVFNNNSFEQGGRLYGAWWQWVPSRFRKFITINAHPTTEVDYSNMQTAMLYAREGLELPDDAYTLPGIDRQYRKLIKKTFFALLNAREDQRIRPPKADQLPPGMSFADLQTAIKEKHRLIAKYLHTGVGIELQKIDAEIALDVMLAAMRDDELVLPVHDSFICRYGYEGRLRVHMTNFYRDRMGAEIGMVADPSIIEKHIEEDDREVYEQILIPEYFLRFQAMVESPEYARYRRNIKAFYPKQPMDWQFEYHGSPIGF